MRHAVSLGGGIGIRACGGQRCGNGGDGVDCLKWGEGCELLRLGSLLGGEYMRCHPKVDIECRGNDQNQIEAKRRQ